mmetsp:Transcript_72510/g.216338  ORF Transcript_72510/g.216338 Transcript_72510/m.216338 type:complete len:215 (+) Transcript_72510:123-767(+)
MPHGTAIGIAPADALAAALRCDGTKPASKSHRSGTSARTQAPAHAYTHRPASPARLASTPVCLSACCALPALPPAPQSLAPAACTASAGARGQSLSQAFSAFLRCSCSAHLAAQSVTSTSAPPRSSSQSCTASRRPVRKFTSERRCHRRSMAHLTVLERLGPQPPCTVNCEKKTASPTSSSASTRSPAGNAVSGTNGARAPSGESMCGHSERAR